MAPHGELGRGIHLVENTSEKKVWTYVEIRDGPPWINGASNHLEKLVGGYAIAHARKEECREWRDNRTGDEGNNI
jgi:hypothetical protein